MKGNRTSGMTLVEMLIAMGVSMIVILGVSQFMVTATKVYQAVDTQVSVQMDAQNAVNTISDMTMEGNNAACLNQGTADVCYVIYYNLGEKDVSGALVNYENAEQRIFWLDQNTHNLYLTHINNKSGTDYVNAISNSHEGKQLLAEGVEEFSITTINESGTESVLSETGIDATATENASPVLSIHVKFEAKNRERGTKSETTKYDARQNVTLRNEVQPVSRIVTVTAEPTTT